MTVDDAHADAAPDQLVGQHQSGRAGADDQDVRIHCEFPDRPSLPDRGQL